ncbi:ATP-binding cassette domain-containing protein [Aeropyrum camini]|uniref:ATP-binding cassette domain-containing protein n=1 Tax=Aeropyrum camini TaxID=229980 RepID=UPI001C42F367|nr:ATP-binding cassette domain-containing protein [Aeropyrum camini]
MVGESREDIAVIVEGVVKIYESRGERVVALREVGLAVARGEVLAIMGPSGSGKTTLLNIIAGIDRPNAGRVVVDGFEVSGAGEEELRRFRLERVGYVFQQHNLIPTLTAWRTYYSPCPWREGPAGAAASSYSRRWGSRGRRAGILRS